ncbi:unnamed protein product [Malus baccata var. baccata]
MLGKIRGKATFLIFLQNFPQDKSTPKPASLFDFRRVSPKPFRGFLLTHKFEHMVSDTNRTGCNQYQTTTQLLQILQHKEEANAQAIANLEKQVGQIAAIWTNPIERSVCHVQVNATEKFESEEKMYNQLGELKMKMMMPPHIPKFRLMKRKCYMTNSIEPNADDSFILNYEREFGIEQKIEVTHTQLTFSTVAKIWWKRQRKKMKKRKKSRVLKLKKQQTYAVPHCLLSTPNFKATRWKKGKKKKFHGVVPHLNDPPSST